MRYFMIRRIKDLKPLSVIMSDDRLEAEQALNEFVNSARLEIVEVAVIGDGNRDKSVLRDIIARTGRTTLNGPGF